MKSDFRGYGLPAVEGTQAQNLMDNFQNLPNKGGTNGIVLGIDALNNIIKELKKGDFDGLMLSFGHSEEKDGNFELVASQIKFAGGNTIDIIKVGKNYASYLGPGVVSEPPGMRCPPACQPPIGHK